MTLFSFIPLATASIVNENYESGQDVYDAVINTFFPVFFVILFNVSGKTGPIKNALIPLLDDLLYNTVTWVIPLVVSLAYDDLLNIKIFSFINMGLHVTCAVYAIVKHKTLKEVEDDFYSFECIFVFLTFFPAIVIPAFWLFIIVTRKLFDTISIVFLTLFGILSFTIYIYFILFSSGSERTDVQKIIKILFIPGWFYLPNITQTLFIVIKWPINFYFVKACIFILVLSLTRNVSFFTEEKAAPDEFLATSTTWTQCWLRGLIDEELKKDEENQIIEGMKKPMSSEVTNESQTDETQKEIIKEMYKLIAEMKETQKNESQKYETLKEEMKSMAEMNNKSMAEMKELLMAEMKKSIK